MAAKQSRSAPRPAGRRPGPGQALPFALIDGAIAVLAVMSLVLLWRDAANAWLTTDECFHAHVSRWIAEHRSLPRVIPGLYSGMPYFYPPLFHVLGAASVAVAGPGSLPYLNVFLTGALHALLFLAPLPGVAPVARRWAVVFMLANASLALYGVRLYAEVLATLLAVAAILLLLALRARPGAAAAIALGVVTGLALLAKQPMVLLPALLAMLAIVYLVRGERRLGSLLLAAAGLGVLLAAPFFGRNLLLFGSPFYPPVTTGAQAALDALNTALFSPSPLRFYRRALEFSGPVLPWLLAGVAGWALVRGPRDLRLGLIGLVLGFVALAPWIARFEPRHLHPFVAVAAVLALGMLADFLAGRRRVVIGISVLLIAWGGVALVTRREFRPVLNVAPPIARAIEAVRDHVPAGETVLSLWTYDTFYHSGRMATWPIPWSRSADLLPLFTSRDPDVFLSTLERQGVDWVVVPRSPPPARFDGANYPASFLDDFLALVRDGRLEIVWQSSHVGLARRARQTAGTAVPADSTR